MNILSHLIMENGKWKMGNYLRDTTYVLTLFLSYLRIHIKWQIHVSHSFKFLILFIYIIINIRVNLIITKFVDYNIICVQMFSFLLYFYF